MKPGRTTSEFKFSVLAALAGIALVVLGLHYDDDALKVSGAAMVAWAAYGYSRSRGEAKGSGE